MANDLPEEENGTEEIQHVTREELRQARLEAKAAKRSAQEKAEKEKQAAAQQTSKKSGKGKAVQSAATGKPKLSKRIAKTFKEMISELKKVNWPKWKTVLSSTLVVIVIVLFFLLILMAMDTGLGKLLELLVKKAGF